MKFINLLLIIYSIININNYIYSQPPDDKEVSKQGELLPEAELRYNQKLVHPNQYQAPTMEEQLQDANFTKPLLSNALLETDPERKLRKHDFIETLRFPMYRLTKGETEQIFDFADGNRDDLLAQGEWDDFTALYIHPFEACDKNGDYLLDLKEFSLCFDKDPRSSLIKYKRRYLLLRHKLIMETLTTRVMPFLNFHDFLFIRRTMYSWKNCQSNSIYISKSAFKCAFRTTLPQKFHLKIDLNNIYDTGLRISNDKSLIELDFINYLRIMYHSYVFVIFGAPMSVPYLEKTQFIKSIREDRLPNNFEEKEVDVLYDLINTNPLIPVTQMNFESFSFFFNLHRQFNKFSIDRPLQLRKFELLKLLDDDLTPQMTVHSVDRARTNFTTNKYLEASLVLQRLRENERDFYFNRFKSKQDASEITAAIYNDTSIDATFYNFTKNETNREIFFSVMCDMNKDYWSKEVFYRAFHLTNLFAHLVPDKSFVVSTTTFIDELHEAYAKVVPAINYEQRTNYNLYKKFPREISLDVLVFLALENHRWKYAAFMKSSNQYVYETNVKMIMNDNGMFHMPDTVIDLAKKGFDSLRRRQYDPEEVTINTCIVQAVASEYDRNHDMDIKFLTRKTREVSRQYQPAKRRFEASPMI